MTITRRDRRPLGRVVALAACAWAALGAPLAAQEATPGAIAPYVPGAAVEELEGRIIVDGSSTVWPISAEVAELFRGVVEDVVVEVEISGTGGGFRRFCAGDGDLQNASRPITEEERAACGAAGVDYHEFVLGSDGITVVVNPGNGFASCLTVDQLRRLWQADAPARVWRDLDPAWPDREIELYGPGPDSGTYDYFAEAVLGEAGLSRDDYTPSENDRILVDGVAADPDALGYFGFAYFAETSDRLKAVAVDGGAGCVVPSRETIADGSYAPLSRPLYLYLNRDALARPEVREFVRFYLASARQVVNDVGYAPLPDAAYAANQAELEGALAGATPADGPDAVATPAA